MHAARLLATLAFVTSLGLPAGCASAEDEPAKPATAAAAPAATAPAAATAASAPATYDVVTTPASETEWNAIKYEIYTGKAWKLDQGRWVPIPDPVDPGRGTYKVEMIPLRDDWGALRYDIHSGRSWVATVPGWSEITEGPLSPAE